MMGCCFHSLQGMRSDREKSTWHRSAKKQLSGRHKDAVRPRLFEKKKVKELEEQLKTLQKEHEELNNAANKIKQGNIVLVEQNRQLTTENQKQEEQNRQLAAKTRQQEEVISNLVAYKTNMDKEIEHIINSELVPPLDNSIAWNAVGTQHRSAFHKQYLSSNSFGKMALSAAFVKQAIFCLAEESVHSKERISQLERENQSNKNQIYQNEQRIYDLENKDKLKDEKISALEKEIKHLTERFSNNINQHQAIDFMPARSIQTEENSSEMNSSQMEVVTEKDKQKNSSVIIEETDKDVLVEEKSPTDTNKEVSMDLNGTNVEKDSINLNNNCSYSGELREGIPHGMGIFNHGQQAFSIFGYFANGYLDLTKPVKFEDCCGTTQEFQVSNIVDKNKKEFNKKLLIPIDSLCKVIGSLCSNNSLSLIISKTSQIQEGIVFNKNFVYLGMLDFDYGLPAEKGFILKSDGEVQEGSFSRQGWIKDEWLRD